ncbi:MAG: recombinase zinc ribbon domain-containing protein [Solirubrobacteraceae bacterium]
MPLSDDDGIHFHAFEIEQHKAWDLAIARGIQPANIQTVWHKDFKGDDHERLEPYIERMELPGEHPDRLDVLIVASYARYNRADKFTTAKTEFRITQAGGDLWFADSAHLDLYDSDHAVFLEMLRYQAEKHRLETAKSVKAAVRLRARQGRPGVASWGCAIAKSSFTRVVETTYTKLDRNGNEVVVQAGDTITLPVGSIVDVPACRPLGERIYRDLDAGVPPTDIARWMNKEAEENPAARRNGERRRDKDTGEVVELPAQPWSQDTIVKWALKVQNKGWVQLGEHLQWSESHDGCIDEQTWDRVVAELTSRKRGSSTGTAPSPYLASGILRCQNCRSTLVIRRPRGKTVHWVCGSNQGCRAKPSVSAAAVESIIDATMRLYLGSLSEAVATADDDVELERLRRAMLDAQHTAAVVAGDLQLYSESRERYTALSRNAEAASDAALSAYHSAADRSRMEHMSRTALSDWETMDVADKHAIVVSAYPVIWVRLTKFISPSGEILKTRDLADRLWFVDRDASKDFLLPAKGVGYVAAAHEPITWHDGSTVATQEQRCARHGRATSDGIAGTVPTGASAEDLQRWRFARAHFLEHGRTADEVLSMRAEHENGARAALELGMSQQTFYKRVSQARIEKGEIEGLTVVQRARRKRVAEGRSGVTDEEVLAAVELASGNYTRAGRELGLSYHQLVRRYAKASGDPVLLARFERQAARAAKRYREDPAYRQSQTTRARGERARQRGVRSARTPHVWNDEAILRALETLCEGRTRFPGEAAFRAASLGGLYNRLIRTGTLDQWAQRMALPRAGGTNWGDEKIMDELRLLCAGRETFPTRVEFKEAGCLPLYLRISRRGGVAHWAQRLGLPRERNARA